ncbi:flagellar basal body rod protein [Bacillus coahuilensis m2-6]|uniref:lmo0954 family membrane protein n=1 Tax=Bacillus coahuilensis TaxID=408580 RepID=UPI0003072321|nr:hypothetical protein [Bacillus coahuilensis]KUP09837.1 flagellar basal body rod protein [Bacillus coahuilensis m2-6]
MRKFGLFMVGGIAAVVALANVGPMIGLALSLIILYFAFKEFLKAHSTFAKIAWVVIGLIALSSSVASLPAVIGLAAIYVIYLIWKNWNKDSVTEKSSDPFTNFEREWNSLKN